MPVRFRSVRDILCPVALDSCISKDSLSTCYEVVCQAGNCGGVILEQFDQPAIRARSTSYVCDVEFGLRNLSAWVQAHQEDSRNPNRKIYSLVESLFSLLPTDGLPQDVGL